MAMRTLGEALESALASILNEVGEGDVGASPDAVKVAKSRGKEAGTDKAPASQEIVSTRRGKLKTASVTTQPGKAPASRANGTGSPVHSPAQPQRRTGRPLPFLIVDNGDRPAQGGGVKPGGLRTDPGMVRAREFLKLVHAALL